MTAAVGWAVVGPEGVVVDSVGQHPLHAKAWAERAGLRHWMTGDFNDGYRLARVRIEVIEESDDE